jgi:hypothetical protein
MVEFDCGTCEVTLEAVATSVRPSLDENEAAGAYPPHLLRCPRCGASWEQRASGRVTKTW